MPNSRSQEEDICSPRTLAMLSEQEIETMHEKVRAQLEGGRWLIAGR